MTLEQRFEAQHLANGYELVNGVEMRDENGEQFQIPHPVLKKHVGVGHFVNSGLTRRPLGLTGAKNHRRTTLGGLAAAVGE